MLLRLRRMFCVGIKFGLFIRQAMYLGVGELSLVSEIKLCSLVHFLIGDGHHCFVWFDPWLTEVLFFRNLELVSF